jgi:hypothetical protein
VKIKSSKLAKQPYKYKKKGLQEEACIPASDAASASVGRWTTATKNKA